MATQERSEEADTAERDAAGDDRPAASSHGQVSPWEWVVAALGLALIVGTIGLMLYRAVAGGNAPPRIELAVATIQPAGDGYLVTFTATNRGDTTAVDLAVEGELRGDGGSVEVSTATLSYVAAGSQRQGGLFFATDPRTGQLTLRPTGYEQP